jgi:cytochrome c oxidase subunit 2
MAAEEQPTPPPAAPAAREPNHLRRFLIIWIIGSIAAVAISIWVLGPKLPPGKASDAAAGQVTDNIVLLAMSSPVLMLILTYIVYAVINFRQVRAGEEGPAHRGERIFLEGPAIRGNAGMQTFWVISTSTLVLALAVYGTVRLFGDYGAGSGSGPSPLTKPPGKKLRVQVIGQQWYFTYRWPEYGGVETPHLVLPVNREVEFNVTSLDVIHSFWAYQLGVKADANPQINNVAFARPEAEGSFEIRCAELCGIWHGEMNDTGRIVSQPAFESWIAEQQTKFAPATKQLPPFSKTYHPDPARRGG